METIQSIGTLGGWMNEVLVSWGFSPKYANMFDEIIVAALIILLAIGLNYFFQAIVVGGVKRHARRFPRLWNTLLVKPADESSSVP